MKLIILLYQPSKGVSGSCPRNVLHVVIFRHNGVILGSVYGYIGFDMPSSRAKRL